MLPSSLSMTNYQSSWSWSQCYSFCSVLHLRHEYVCHSWTCNSWCVLNSLYDQSTGILLQIFMPKGMIQFLGWVWFLNRRCVRQHLVKKRENIMYLIVPEKCISRLYNEVNIFLLDFACIDSLTIIYRDR